jgi:hypothetical protein
VIVEAESRCSSFRDDAPARDPLMDEEVELAWQVAKRRLTRDLRLDDHAVRNDLALIAAFLRSFGSLPEGLSDLISGIGSSSANNEVTQALWKGPETSQESCDQCQVVTHSVIRRE